MPRLQQEMVVLGKDVVETDVYFMGKPVWTSTKFAYRVPLKFYKRGRNKRLIKKWIKKYGCWHKPRTDAVIYSHLILCHPDTLWRFNIENFVAPEGTIIGENEHDIHL